MRILLDECLPEVLKEWLPDREVKTVREMGWNPATNGALLRRTEGQFDILVTADRKLRHQQSLKGLRLAVLVLPSNRLKVLRGMRGAIEEAIGRMEPGKPDQYLELGWPGER